MSNFSNFFFFFENSILESKCFHAKEILYRIHFEIIPNLIGERM